MSSFVRQPMFHPVSVVFLDDSEDFLNGLQGLFRDRELNRFFTKPQTALEFMLSCDRGVPLTRIAGADYSEVEKGCSNALGRDALNDDARFEEVAAVVVDYEMPEIDGIQFLSSINDAACTKILLTGAAGDREAVDAFNAGLIDFYIRKGDAVMPQKLTNALADAKKKHCSLRGAIPVHDVGASYRDSRVVRLLDEIAARDSYVEYYWRPEQNSVLMFDAAGEAAVFVAWDEHDWTFQCDMVMDAGGPESLHREMTERRTMPLFWPHQAYQADLSDLRTVEPTPVPDWDGAFYSLTRVDGSALEPGQISFAQWRQMKRGELR